MSTIYYVLAALLLLAIICIVVVIRSKKGQKKVHRGGKFAFTLVATTFVCLGAFLALMISAKASVQTYLLNYDQVVELYKDGKVTLTTVNNCKDGSCRVYLKTNTEAKFLVNMQEIIIENNWFFKIKKSKKVCV